MSIFSLHMNLEYGMGRQKMKCFNLLFFSSLICSYLTRQMDKYYGTYKKGIMDQNFGVEGVIFS